MYPLTDLLKAFNDGANLAESGSEFQSFEAEHEMKLSFRKPVYAICAGWSASLLFAA